MASSRRRPPPQPPRRLYRRNGRPGRRPLRGHERRDRRRRRPRCSSPGWCERRAEMAEVDTETKAWLQEITGALIALRSAALGAAPEDGKGTLAVLGHGPGWL